MTKNSEAYFTASVNVRSQRYSGVFFNQTKKYSIHFMITHLHLVVLYRQELPLHFFKDFLKGFTFHLKCI